MSAPANGFGLIRAAYDVPGLDEHERGILVLLAFMANKRSEAWPSVLYLVEKTGQSERTVQRAIQRLVLAGHISRRQRRHDSAVYSVHPAEHDPKPVTLTPVNVTPVSVTPDENDAKARQSDTLIAKNNHKNNGERARAMRLPEGWQPGPLPGKVAALVSQWPPGREDREADTFRDYWRSRPRDAARLDWDATWHNRIRDQHDRIMRENRHGAGNRTHTPAVHGSGRRAGEVDAALRQMGISRSDIYE